MSVTNRLKSIIEDKLVVEREDITRDADLRLDFGADAIDILEIMDTIEDEFDIQIPEEEREDLITVGDAIDYIKNCM